ncbi:D-glycerate dehydrogenase [Aliifodinibius salipaludis]|uniref:D-glycerate dehydrogenase n=1 Tax=Fodinibius salipaludis TaxID=2032627 RepID=A0A2A2GB38_9BACT|nr:D-glycerate dehydrogenase [Aliifodinibius salipaludis]PAU94069.1 D-glycerate dehydrogenase [Aliifodinibius salipaludis]
MAKSVLITEPIIPSVIEKLEKRYQVDVGEPGTYNDEQILADDIPAYDALLPMLSNPVTEKVIAAGSNLEIIANHAVGYNNIDLEAAQKHNVAVANTPDVLTDSCAEFTLGLMLAVSRRLFEAQKYLLEGKFNNWEPLGFLGKELNDSTLGVIGMGRIGTGVARRAKALGMDIIYHNRSKVDPDLEQELDAQYCSTVQELVKQSDIVTLHCPLTDETHHLINEEILSLMPEDTILINTSRGAVVDEEALAHALHNGSIGGAGLDVFENEPELHPKLKTAPNCIRTPHIASASFQTRKAIGMLAADAIIGILEGKPTSEIPNLIQP